MILRPAGPAAWLLDLEAPATPETARHLGAVRERLRRTAPATVRDLIPGYTSLLVETRAGASAEAIAAWLRAADPERPSVERSAQHDPVDEDPPTPGRHHTVRVAYGREADREALERRLGLPWERIVALHRGAEYTVAFLGFTPGFPYLLGLPESLHTPRRETPRTRVPAGAVAIAGGQAGIYPSASPGGWWILGTSDARPFDPRRWPPSDWAPGDVVRFEPAVDEAPGQGGAGRGPSRHRGADGGGSAGDAPGAAPTEARLGAPIGPPEAEPAASVEEAWPPSATLQADARRWVGHFGLAQAGALDPLAAEFANAAVGNPRHAPTVELVALPLRLRALRPLRAALAGGGHDARLDTRPLRPGTAFAWPEGGVLELRPAAGRRGRTSYLAVAGGLAAHAYAGSTSTDVRGGVGGSRRPLRPGDVLGWAGATSSAGRPGTGSWHYPERIELRLHPGPQAEPEAWRALIGSSFRVAAGDRTGVRLEGPPVPAAAPDVRSEGAMWGAVQVPADGQPIVLLADRGRTGGYAKPAVVDVRDLWRLAQAPPGTEVWLVPAARSGTGSRGPWRRR